MGKYPNYIKDDFFKKMERDGLALTYDEVRLKTGYSIASPSEVSLGSWFSRNIPLKSPIVSAAMDKVTEHKMAIAMAMCGGIGILHGGMSAERQASQVARVKRHLNGVIENPICVREEENVKDVLDKCAKKGFTFRSFPVIGVNGVLVGVLTSTDLDLCSDCSTAKVRDIMTKGNLVTAPPNTTIRDAYTLMKEARKKVLPLIDDGGRIKGMYVLSDSQRILFGSNESALYNVDANGRLRVGAGVSDGGEEELKRVELLVGEGVDVLVVETAHADTPHMVKTIQCIRARFPDVDLVSGNISEPDSAKRLADLGVDGIKVGQGPGATCTTRIVAGVGCPQATAVYNCCKALRGFEIPVCADGGIRYSGDIPIALGLGADSVMIGTMLAGTDESPGEVREYRGIRVKEVRGMGSPKAMAASKAARDRYRTEKDGSVPEGGEGYVVHRGSLASLLHQLVGGLRKGMGYVGAESIEELQAKADFHRLSMAGIAESHPHDMVLTENLPNYWRDA